MMQQATAPLLEDDAGGSDPAHDVDALPPGTQLLGGQYVVEGYLSSGGFGITYLARDSLDRRVVIKECYPEAMCSRKEQTVRVRTTALSTEFQTLVSMFVREARSVAKLKHPNIVGVHQVFEANQTAYMALDLIEGRDLFSIIDNTPDMLTPPVVIDLLTRLLDAIGTVHDMDMLHRDISPDNILLDANGTPVLIDFGAAREEASKKSRAISALLMVKDGYSPQEFYISGGRQGPSSDLYSLAATFYHVITGAPPVNSQNRLAALANNRRDPYQPLAAQALDYPPAFLAAIDMAMSAFPDDRLQSARDWLAAINTPDWGAATGQPQGSEVGAHVTPGAGSSKAPPVAEIRQIVSQLVSEAEENLAHLPEERAFKRPTPPKVPARKPAEPLRIEHDPHDTEPQRPAARNTEAINRLWDRLGTDEHRRQVQVRQRRRWRRLAVLALLGALALHVQLDPQSNFAARLGPEFQTFLTEGQAIAGRVVDFLLTS